VDDRRGPECPLEMLAAHLVAHRLDVDLNGRGLLVRDQGTGVVADLVTCWRRVDDSGAPPGGQRGPEFHAQVGGLPTLICPASSTNRAW
jgi:hypothetical protein